MGLLREIAERHKGRQETLAWTMLCILAGLVLANSLTTSAFSPKLNRDEAEIVEYGRLMLEPNAGGCLEMMPSGRPETLFCWISCLTHELAYRTTHHHDIPRILAAAGWLLATLLGSLWLRQRGVPAGMACLVGLVLMLDPIGETPVRLGRPDSWVWAMTFLAALLVRVSFTAKSKAFLLAVLGGVCAGLLPWIWVTGFVLCPLVLLEWWDARKGQQAGNEKKLLIALMLGLTAGFFLGAVPVWGSLKNGASALMNMMQWNAGMQSSTSLLYVLKNVLFVVMLHPFFLMLVGCGMLSRGFWPWTLATLGLVGLMSATRIYDARYYYALPYMVPLLAEGADRLASKRNHAPWVITAVAIVFVFMSAALFDYRWVIMTPLAIGLIVAGWITVSSPTSSMLKYAVVLPALLAGFWASVVIRDYAAMQQAPVQDYKKLLALAEEKVGKGPIKVFCPYAFYFPGRQLGWEMYRFRIVPGADDIKKLMGKCDTVILDEDLADDNGLDVLAQEAGFGLVETFSLGEIAFRYQGLGQYGPFKLYRKSAVQ
jgi:hypothetical protein